MNEVFKNMKSKRIQLDNEFFLTPDGFKGLVLQREFQKSRIKKDTKETENYTDEIEGDNQEEKTTKTFKLILHKFILYLVFWGLSFLMYDLISSFGA